MEGFKINFPQGSRKNYFANGLVNFAKAPLLLFYVTKINDYRV